MLPAGLEPAEIDARVASVTARGEALYELDGRRLAGLEPDLIVTQALCAVCAVSYDDVRAVAAAARRRAPPCSRSTRLGSATSSTTLETLAAAAGNAGCAGSRCGPSSQARLGAVRAAVAAAPRPRVAAIEWLDPPYAPATGCRR